MLNIYPVILAGGSGSRLWPLSRKEFPKQFLSLHSENSLLEETITRAKKVGFQSVTIITNEAYRFNVAASLQNLETDFRKIVLEPVARNTAPAIAACAIDLMREDPDALMLVQPSDHIITKPQAFLDAVKSAASIAQEGQLVAFGIKPEGPSVAFGYIKASEADNDLPAGIYPIEKFVEKPDLETAKKFVNSGSYSWNAGIFLMSAKVFVEELDKYQPDIVSHVTQSVNNAKSDLDFFRLQEEAFSKANDISVDYAVMERTAKSVVCSLDIGWSDVGSFDALWQTKEKSPDQNAVDGEAYLVDTRNSLVHTTDHKVVGLVGLDGIVVIDTMDALLVADRKKSQDVKKIVNQLVELNRSQAFRYPMSNRPWGEFRQIDYGNNYQVKHISVKPGASLSLQYHNHRAEHWIVVEGTATVTCEGKTFQLQTNESTFIPKGHTHRLENATTEPLIIIEVQSGSYLGRRRYRSFGR